MSERVGEKETGRKFQYEALYFMLYTQSHELDTGKKIRQK
jgi:hypothetical protein